MKTLPNKQAEPDRQLEHICKKGDSEHMEPSSAFFFFSSPQSVAGDQPLCHQKRKPHMLSDDAAVSPVDACSELQLERMLLLLLQPLPLLTAAMRYTSDLSWLKFQGSDLLH